MKFREWRRGPLSTSSAKFHRRPETGERARLNAQAFQSAPLLIGSEESKNELYFVIS